MDKAIMRDRGAKNDRLRLFDQAVISGRIGVWTNLNHYPIGYILPLIQQSHKQYGGLCLCY